MIPSCSWSVRCGWPGGGLLLDMESLRPVSFKDFRRASIRAPAFPRVHLMDLSSSDCHGLLHLELIRWVFGISPQQPQHHVQPSLCFVQRHFNGCQFCPDVCHHSSKAFLECVGHFVIVDVYYTNAHPDAHCKSTEARQVLTREVCFIQLVRARPLDMKGYFQVANNQSYTLQL